MSMVPPATDVPVPMPVPSFLPTTRAPHCMNTDCCNRTEAALRERIAAGVAAEPLLLWTVSIPVHNGPASPLGVDSVTLTSVVLCTTCVESLTPRAPTLMPY